MERCGEFSAVSFTLFICFKAIKIGWSFAILCTLSEYNFLFVLGKWFTKRIIWKRKGGEWFEAGNARVEDCITRCQQSLQPIIEWSW